MDWQTQVALIAIGINIAGAIAAACGRLWWTAAAHLVALACLAVAVWR